MIELQKISIHLGQFALRDVSLKVDDSEYVVMTGRSGQGKTTLLECICGLRAVTSGRVLVSGHDVTRLSPAEREIGYVPQDHALFTTMTVRDHLTFALKLRRWSTHAMNSRVDELAESLQLQHLLSRKPAGLSGGESQRVAIGRALSFLPGVLLLDEPFSSLDSELRLEMYELLRTLRRSTNAAILHVTHNKEDAVALADRCLVLKDGRIHEEPSTT